MRLSEIFNYLSREKLDRPLKEWFKRSFSTIEGKIISLHYARELDLERWESSRFGCIFSKGFALFLKSREPYDDPVKAAKNFCISNKTFQLSGVKSKSKPGTIVCVIKLDHIINALGKEFFAIQNSDEKKCQEIKRLLKKHKISIAHEGISWLTIFEEGLDQITYAKEACDLVGKEYRLNKCYLALEPKQNDYLCRPTISDGRLEIRFRPFCDGSGWGITLKTSSFGKGLPEAIKKDIKEFVELKKYFLPSNEFIIQEQLLKEKYFENEKNEFKRKNSHAFNDLLYAWKQYPFFILNIFPGFFRNLKRIRWINK